ncbi:MAG: stage 0 sporulation family protein [Clostridia bacterium]|nr:stage 0 sporulation family protein [Clostridia bacterium]
MTKVISVKFRDNGKGYYFKPIDGLKIGDTVIVDTASGNVMGTVCEDVKEVSDDQIVSALKKVIRKATNEDIKMAEENKKKEPKAFEVCAQKIVDRGLLMKLVDVEYSIDGGRITFFFTADGRIDFRELVKDLAAHFHTRIELRQIGVRDEARMLGGLGICGYPYCCKQFLDDFQPVSIKMAKEQGLSLNPTKISGSCGRLMCCLKYEQESYDHLMKITPGLGSTVKTPEGIGIVTDVNLITGNLMVKSKDDDGIIYKINRKDVKILASKKKNEGNDKPEEPQK